jgi:hypothetical protein
MKTKKLGTFVILSVILVSAIILLNLWEGTNWLQGVYLWIAELENSARGIDGITEASRVKVMDDAERHFPILIQVCNTILIIAFLISCHNVKQQLDRKDH